MALSRWEQRVDVLGPVTVRGAGGIVPLTRTMEIGVLGVLALNAGSAVTSASLVDVLWPTEPPRTAGKTLQGYVKRVRSMVAVNGIELKHSAPAGYVLSLPPDRVDALQFESLVTDARTTPDDALRLRRLDDALALWRGEPFAGSDLDGLRPHRDWLVGLHSGTRVERTATEIRLGVTAETVATIRALLRDEPTNERLWLHLAGALYLDGNPAAALEAVATARRELGDRVGVDLGPELGELQARILDHDDVENCYYRLTGGRPSSLAGAGSWLAPAPLVPPQWASELVGRDAVVDDVVGLLDGGARIVTLTGSGGMGKTRCAVEAARRATTPCRGFVDLSALTTGSDLALHLAGSFGIPDRDDPLAAIAARLTGPRTSVVLDNVEQIDGAAAVIRELADRCPSVVWLVTSHAELGVGAERVVRLRPLAHEATPDGPSPAAELLATAARRRGVELAMTAPVAEIASLIGGIPLALELAACQLQHLDPTALLRALLDPIDALVDPRQEIDRHRSMRACFQLGLDHLGADATEVFAVVSRRPNGCRYDDLAAWWQRPTPLTRAVAELVEAGFVTTGADVAGATRLSQIPVVRAFGRTLPTTADAASADGALDLALLGRAHGWAMASSWTVVEPDLPDIRRLLQQGLDDPSATDAALQLAVLLTVFWWSARLTEGRQWLDALLERMAGRPSPLRPHAVQTAAFLDFYVGDAATARARLDDELRDEPIDPAGLARLLSLRAMLWAAEGQDVSATQLAERAVELAQGSGDPQSLFYTLGNAGDVATAVGDPEHARTRYVECIEFLRKVGLHWISAAPHARLGDLELSAGEHGRARMWFERSIALWSSRELGPGAPQALAGLGRLDVVVGDFAAARRHLEAALTTAERCGSRGEYPWIVLGYAALAAAEERRDDAAVLFELGLHHGRRAGHDVARLVEAELAPLYAWAVQDPEAVRADPVVVATPLEDLPAVLTAYAGR